MSAQAIEGGWREAQLVAALLAVSPHVLGGVHLKAGPGPVRDAWCQLFAKLMGEAAPIVRLPAHVSLDRLLGEIDSTATLVSGGMVKVAGLLSRANQGALLMPSAEHIEDAVRSAVCNALDAGRVTVELDGLSDDVVAQFALVAFDEGRDGEGEMPAQLSDRLALRCDLSAISYRDIATGTHTHQQIAQARLLLDRVRVDDEIIDGLCQATLAMGIGSGRTEIFAVRCARALAALDGRAAVRDDDLQAAARLVLRHRAISIEVPEEQPEPSPPESEASNDASSAPNDPEQQNDPQDDEPSASQSADEMAEMIIDAVRMDQLGKDVLADMRPSQVRSTSTATGQQASRRLGRQRGRPYGTMRFQSGKAGRINLLATLRAATPWQKLRRNALRMTEASDGQAALDRPSLVIHRDDLRVSRYREQQGSTIIFLVDASGSTALGRLAEAKGAVEMLLFESYRRRDQIALISFRGQAADVLLAPTRSLVRAKRALGALPGGGATPLATGLVKALDLAGQVQSDGRQPVLVLITDGRPNIDVSGQANRQTAKDDALKVARHLASKGWSALVFDASARPNDDTRELSRMMNASYRHLPYMTSHSVASAVRDNLKEAAKAG